MCRDKEEFRMMSPWMHWNIYALENIVKQVRFGIYWLLWSTSITWLALKSDFLICFHEIMLWLHVSSPAVKNYFIKRAMFSHYWNEFLFTDVLVCRFYCLALCLCSLCVLVTFCNLFVMVHRKYINPLFYVYFLLYSLPGR